MNTEMSDQEKSAMLARLCNGWLGVIDLDSEVINLYDSDLMPLAWRVLNWACENLPNDNTDGYWCGSRIYLNEFIEYSGFEKLSPAAAQRAWLDKVLELAIEAGMVTK